MLQLVKAKSVCQLRGRAQRKRDIREARRFGHACERRFCLTALGLSQGHLDLEALFRSPEIGATLDAAMRRGPVERSAGRTAPKARAFRLGALAAGLGLERPFTGRVG